MVCWLYHCSTKPLTHRSPLTTPQGRCRSCYAFATTGVLEGLHALTTGKLVTLSEQNIIDCSGKLVAESLNNNNSITSGRGSIN